MADCGNGIPVIWLGVLADVVFRYILDEPLVKAGMPDEIVLELEHGEFTLHAEAVLLL